MVHVGIIEKTAENKGFDVLFGIIRGSFGKFLAWHHNSTMR